MKTQQEKDQGSSGAQNKKEKSEDTAQRAGLPARVQYPTPPDTGAQPGGKGLYPKDTNIPAVLQPKMKYSQAPAGPVVQKKENNTGLPDNLKSGIESLSGYAMDDVKVHYNSSKPAQLQAHAYAQGTDIHLAPGQEKHLPHEAWHVVQQKQGRVQPTMQMKGKVNVNDDAGLEREADVMGGRALEPQELKGNENTHRLNTGTKTPANAVVQGVFIVEHPYNNRKYDLDKMNDEFIWKFKKTYDIWVKLVKSYYRIPYKDAYQHYVDSRGLDKFNGKLQSLSIRGQLKSLSEYEKIKEGIDSLLGLTKIEHVKFGYYQTNMAINPFTQEEIYLYDLNDAELWVFRNIMDVYFQLLKGWDVSRILNKPDVPYEELKTVLKENPIQDEDIPAISSRYDYAYSNACRIIEKNKVSKPDQSSINMAIERFMTGKEETEKLNAAQSEITVDQAPTTDGFTTGKEETEKLNAAQSEITVDQAPTTDGFTTGKEETEKLNVAQNEITVDQAPTTLLGNPESKGIKKLKIKAKNALRKKFHYLNKRRKKFI